MKGLRGALFDALSVIIDGVRLIWRHWPVLLTLYLFGAAGRGAVLWGAVAVSKHHSTLAGFMLPFAPLCSLTALILMLRAVSGSLRSAAFEVDDAQGRRTDSRLALLAGTLIPFLTVYAAQGYLKDDLQRFVNEATYSELFGNAGAFYGEKADTDRAIMATGTLLAGIVIVALVLRYLLNRFDLPEKSRPVAFVAAYVEVLWLFMLAGAFTNYKDTAWDWVKSRTFVGWCGDRWSWFTNALGPIGRPVDDAVQWAWSVFGEVNAIVVIPIAWLTVGAVVYGRQLAAPERVRTSDPTRWQQRVARVPAPVRRIGHEATSDMRRRFTSLGGGLRLLALGGLVPMMLFCLVFYFARETQVAVSELVRLLVGPQQRDTALAFFPHRDLISTAAYTLVLVGLLAAAVDRILVRRDQREAEETAAAASSASSASSGESPLTGNSA